jgi:hypothetical protein
MMIKTDQATAFGISAASRKELGFMGFQRNSSNGQMYLNFFDGRWIQPHEDIPGTLSDTPMMAVLDDMLNIVYNSHDDQKNVLWLQRSFSDYTLDSWMSVPSL